MFLAKLHSFYRVKTSKEGCVVIEFQWWSNPRLCVPCLKQVYRRWSSAWKIGDCWLWMGST
ncbi:hypothetical protein Goklo_021635 [Gossypium klotzschianum]|uniref:Uncharacterized protein n=1 Tax=Gossypium klotzschianum TaxID=34286 RepID=A0A7J8UWJ0_9ROSI|nr:hypothetical protein [Gossypium klotzschianum]